jgi:DHA2 family multidrug resistance protein-like MFS transporter
MAAFSTSTEMLIASRALMGIAGATLSPSTLALISNMFRDPRQMGTAIGIWVSCFMGGMALGPVVGGAMLEFFWWGSVFLLAVPVMGLLLVLGPMFLPEFKTPEAGKLDPLSVALSLGVILPVVYGINSPRTAGAGCRWAPSLSAWCSAWCS